MGVKKILKTFKRNKSQFETEEAAFADVVKVSGEAETNLRAEHTDKQYRWTMIR